MNLINLLVVLLVCVYQGGVEGVQVKRCPCKDRYFPVGRVPDERSVTLTIRNVSAASEPTVILVGGREETAMTSLMRAADSDSRFEFSGKYTEADGFFVTGFQGRTNGEDGHWDISTFPKDGSDSVPITSGLDRVISKVGDNLVFSFLPPKEQLEEWEMIFSVKAGTNKKVYEAWTGSASVNSADPDANLYKSDKAEEWSTVDKVKVAILKNNEEKSYFIFNGQGADKTSFFAYDRLVNSSNGLLKGQRFFTFSTQGDDKYKHRFSINKETGDDGCSDFVSWLVVLDTGNIVECPFDEQDTRPLFLYCVGEPACQTSTAPTGDTFTISVTRT